MSGICLPFVNLCQCLMLSWISARTRLAMGTKYIFERVVFYLPINFFFGLQAFNEARLAGKGGSVLEHELFFLRGLRSVGSILDTNISVGT